MGTREHLYERLSGGGRITVDEALTLWDKAPVEELIYVADQLRKKLHPENRVGWIIDRNVNITNICFSQCRFCNFCRTEKSDDAYITTDEEYDHKIGELLALGGDQLLLQGGMNPSLGLDFYTGLFSRLKSRWPGVRLHALGPPEVAWLARAEKMSYRDVLVALRDAGLDSLPGAGAEILSDRVRRLVSPAKATVAEWLGVMREAHRLNLPTSATMMFGHAETVQERLEHLDMLRKLQDARPEGHDGFITFIPWPFMDRGTRLAEKDGIRSNVTATEYLKMIAVSRLMLDNIRNIQASILTVGRETAMISLHAGANDLGSVMIEENVVSAAGDPFRVSPSEMQEIIREAGFTPVRRDQRYQAVEGRALRNDPVGHSSEGAGLQGRQ
ncbi:MAG: cyclic dehypoxanthinyl futalosine synthase [Bacteroidales bacterium]|jgi:cyclic dehypoxanthinyl futalosine synthase|nr:cyclic dehypoxanthinyl futalosine synthase [Bacteroidales bacterium]